MLRHGQYLGSVCWFVGFWWRKLCSHLNFRIWVFWWWIVSIFIHFWWYHIMSTCHTCIVANWVLFLKNVSFLAKFGSIPCHWRAHTRFLKCWSIMNTIEPFPHIGISLDLLFLANHLRSAISNLNPNILQMRHILIMSFHSLIPVDESLLLHGRFSDILFFLFFKDRLQ